MNINYCAFWLNYINCCNSRREGE